MTLFKDLRAWLKRCDKLTLVFGVIILWNYFAVLPSIPQAILYAALMAYSVYMFKGSSSTNWLYACFIVYLFIEVLVTQPPALFQSQYRVAIFALVLCCFSPMFGGAENRRRRDRLMQMALWFCLGIGVASFFGWFLGINYMHVRFSDVINAVGLFGGFTPHSMLLAPLASIGAIFSVYLALQRKQKVFWAFALFCMGAVLFAASRAALLAVLAGGVAVILKKQRRIGRGVITISAVLIFLIATYSIWSPAMDGMIRKNNGATEQIDFSSRQSKWDARLEEFSSSPLLGVGFCSVSLQHRDDYNEAGGIEPGSSWLSVLSMTGVAGLLFVLSFVYKALLAALRSKSDESALSLGVLCFFIVHMLAEGYIFFGGSLLCMMFWLSIAVCKDDAYSLIMSKR